MSGRTGFAEVERRVALLIIFALLDLGAALGAAGLVYWLAWDAAGPAGLFVGLLRRLAGWAFDPVLSALSAPPLVGEMPPLGPAELLPLAAGAAVGLHALLGSAAAGGEAAGEALLGLRRALWPALLGPALFAGLAAGPLFGGQGLLPPAGAAALGLGLWLGPLLHRLIRPA